MNWAKTTARRDENHLSLGIWCVLYYRLYVNQKNGFPVWPFTVSNILSKSTRPYKIAVCHPIVNSSWLLSWYINLLVSSSQRDEKVYQMIKWGTELWMTLKPFGAEIGIFWEKQVNAMAVDGLASCVARPSQSRHWPCTISRPLSSNRNISIYLGHRKDEKWWEVQTYFRIF